MIALDMGHALTRRPATNADPDEADALESLQGSLDGFKETDIPK